MGGLRLPLLLLFLGPLALIAGTKTRYLPLLAIGVVWLLLGIVLNVAGTSIHSG